MALSGASASLDAVFQAAVASFEASLTEKQRREFRACSRKEVEDTIRAIDGRLASQRKQRNMQRIAKFVEGMDQLGRVIELFVNVDATVAFVWAPIKFVLLAAGTWVETLDCLLDTYAEIGDFLPSLSNYGNLLAKHSSIGIYLQKYYCDVLEFHRKALAIFSRPSWQTAFHSAWRTFKTQFGPVLTKLKRHRDLLSDEKLTATIADVHHSVQTVEDKIDELSRHLQRLHVVDDDQAARRHREDVDGKRQFVLSKLDPPDYHFDLERASNERWNSASGDWLEADPAFAQWVDTTMTQSRALYLTGMPGTGKTILTSRVVQRLQQLRERGNANGPPFLLLYFFFKHHQPDKRGFVPMLLSLLAQAVFQDEVLLDLVYQRCIRADQNKIRSASLLRELAELVLEAQTTCFVVVDALDECAGDQSVTAEDAQGQVIDWLESLISASQPSGDHEAGSGPNDRCMRLLISGQRNGVLEERLRHWPTVQVDSSLSHMDDIKSYCEAESLRIQKKFGALEDVRRDIVGRVTSTAKGMFLYAKVVLSNLWSQPTRGHFKMELQEENFPKGMDQAYERVAVHILEGPDENQSDLARRVLNLIICAERPLFWKEIQARFCINVESGTADPDFRLLEPGKRYCGALIEVGRKGVPGSQGSEPDDLVELVHETAQKYLLHTRRFHLPNLHADMALFCAQYLSSAPFSLGMGEFAVTAHCRTGYYGFLDYAAANWWKHARHIECSNDTTILAALAKLADALNPCDQTATGDTAAIRTQIHQIPGDGRDFENAFPIEFRVKRIRACLEPLLAQVGTEPTADLEEVSHLYGHVTYKCSKPWCCFFHAGFETAPARDQHVRQHERPFKCGADGCLSSQVGFAKESELARHNARVHSDAISVHFPSGVARGNIFKAALEGKLELLQEHVAGGASVNATQKDGLTPLFLAARAGHYQVCRWLLEHGAEVDAKCTRNKITALWAAVVNDDLEVACLLIVDHGADTHVRSSTGASMFGLLNYHSCTRIRERFPLEFWYPGKKELSGTSPGVPIEQQPTAGSNRAFPDYQTQLMILEQERKNRLAIERHEIRLAMERHERGKQMQRLLLEQQKEKRLESERWEQELSVINRGQRLQGYQTPETILEQQRTERLAMARQEQNYQLQRLFLEQQKEERLARERRQQNLNALARVSQEQKLRTTHSNQALQEYETQLALWEQQKQKRRATAPEPEEHYDLTHTPESNQALQDYETQLALWEQQQKKRRAMEGRERELSTTTMTPQDQDPSTTRSGPRLQDHQTQLMLLEQQNKKRLEMGRQLEEQNNPSTTHTSQRLPDYQMQLLLLEQQHKERLKMAHQEQEQASSTTTQSSDPVHDYHMQLVQQNKKRLERAIKEQEDELRLQQWLELQNRERLVMEGQLEERDASTTGSSNPLQDE